MVENKLNQLRESLKQLNRKLNNHSLYLDESEYSLNNKLYIVYDDEILMTDNLTLVLNIGFFDFYSNESQENVLQLLKIIDNFIN